MKHIKKKFLIEYGPDDNIEFPPGTEFLDYNNPESKELLKKMKSSGGFIRTDLGDTIAGFVYNIDGESVMIPMPDPTLVYFNYAQSLLKPISQFKKNLKHKLQPGSPVSEIAIIDLYAYYGCVSGFVIMLFTSLDSFIYQNLYPGFEYKKIIEKKRTEIYTTEQIPGLDFNEKLKLVLKQATGKDFFKHDTNATNRISTLKEFRDEIVHTKPGKSQLKYDDLIKRSLNFKYADYLDAVSTLMNFYKPNYIEPCPCKNED